MRPMQNLGSYILWLLVLAGNAFIVFLWTVFGLAAAGTTQSREAHEFLWATALGAGIPLFMSLYYISRQRFTAGTVVTILMMPLVVGFFLLTGLFH